MSDWPKVRVKYANPEDPCPVGIQLWENARWSCISVPDARRLRLRLVSSLELDPAESEPPDLRRALESWSDQQVGGALLSRLWLWYDAAGASSGRRYDCLLLEAALDMLSLPRPAQDIGQRAHEDDILAEATRRKLERVLGAGQVEAVALDQPCSPSHGCTGRGATRLG